MSPSDVVVCDPVRTPVGVDGGVFATLTAADLATQALQGLIARTGLGEGDVDDVVLERLEADGREDLLITT